MTEIDGSNFGMILAGPPELLVQSQTGPDCGCVSFVGKRLDNHELSCVTYSCGPRHSHRTAHLLSLLKESMVEPLDVPLIKVVAELWDQVERTYADDP